MLVHRTTQRGGQTIVAKSRHGMNAYVLSTTMQYNKFLKVNSYIRINNTTDFGIAIARRIPGLINAFEGPCFYQEKKIIERDLGYVDINQFKIPGSPKEINKKVLNDYVISKMQHYPFFLKDKSFSEQMEYRFVWIVKEKKGDYLDIKVPKAMQYCQKPNELTE